MKKNKTLGKSIEELFNQNTMADFFAQQEGHEDSVERETKPSQELLLEAIEASPDQPRRHFDQEKLEELATSIKNQGIIQPLVVSKTPHGTFKIIAGERRFRAAKIAGLQKVPVIVKEYSQTDTMLVALIENIQREDLNPIEKAFSFNELCSKIKIKQQDLAQMLGISRAAVANTMRLLKLESDVQEKVAFGDISEGHGKILAGLDPQEQTILAEKIIKFQLTVRDLEKIIEKKESAQKNKKTKKSMKSGLEQELEELFLTRVDIRSDGKGKGKIVLYYNSQEELNGIIEKMVNEVEVF
jgi:ParB family chromosome partitioning protein